MDLDKLRNDIMVTGWQFLLVFMLTLKNPVARFQLQPTSETGINRIAGPLDSERELFFNPKLLWFAGASILLGLAVNALIPNRISGPDQYTALVIVFAYWLIAGSVTFVFCRLLRGTGGYLETLSVFIQISAVLYVATSFLSVFSIPVLHPLLADLFSSDILGPRLTVQPVVLFFIIGLLLSIIYVPLAMKSVHKFGWIRTAAVAAVPLAGVLIQVAIYEQYGVLITEF